MLNDIVKPLTEWYRQNKRSLPWRDRHNAYYTWVSEIMLQQTRVEAVKPYFRRFTEELPDPAALAECPEEKLLKLWEGLGYYNRVRNMQIAAQTVVEEYDGVLPASYEKLLSLKGIGSYTAGAIASIAYDIPVPAVDGNVLRVITRIIEDDGDIMKQSVKKRIENKLQEIMPGEYPGDFNQALMELGAVVCVPNGEPKCDVCPVAFCCGARAHVAVGVTVTVGVGETVGTGVAVTVGIGETVGVTVTVGVGVAVGTKVTVFVCALIEKQYGSASFPTSIQEDPFLE